MEEWKADTVGHWSVTVAQHLLVKLALHNTYTVNICHGVTSKTELCPCKEHDVMVGRVGDTSYGKQNKKTTSLIHFMVLGNDDVSFQKKGNLLLCRKLLISSNELQTSWCINNHCISKAKFSSV